MPKIAPHARRQGRRQVGGEITGPGPEVKTVGSYWHYAAKVFDFTRPAMPWTAPKSHASTSATTT